MLNLHVFFVDLVYSDRKAFLQELTAVRSSAEATERMVASICVQKGASVELPVMLPLSNESDFNALEEWLQTAKNFDQLVSIIA